MQTSSESRFAIIMEWLTVLYVITLMFIFMISVPAEPIVVVTQNSLYLLAGVILILLSYRFSDLQIPGFLSVSKKLDNILNEPPIDEGDEIIMPMGPKIINDEERITELYSGREYLASVSLLRTVIFKEIKRGFEIRGIDVLSDIPSLKDALLKHNIYDEKIIEGILYIENIYKELRKIPENKLLINHDKFGEAIELGLARYFSIIHLNEHPEDQDI
ncbi:MAG: hypothetical protein ACTSW1_01010 [Candidatus Hodarchaeales archaeon]